MVSGEAGATQPAGGGTGADRDGPAAGTDPAGRVRSWLGGPFGARLVGAVCAVAGVALLVVGLITLRGKPPDGGRPPGSVTTTTTTTSSTATASSAPSTAGTPTPTRTTAAPSTPPPPTATRTTPRPAPPPRPPLTVLNNSVQPGLAEVAAARFSAGGWQVALVGNFAGRIPSTTVYYTPGDPAQQRAAQVLAAQFRGIHRILPRYSGLPPTPPGLVVVVTRDWTA